MDRIQKERLSEGLRWDVSETTASQQGLPQDDFRDFEEAFGNGSGRTVTLTYGSSVNMYIIASLHLCLFFSLFIFLIFCKKLFASGVVLLLFSLYFFCVFCLLKISWWN
ncbi:hypothetical protein CEXT_430671 [Caerostris extrusa]|uniref:Uncharacterized protein n=1 Tax=Caerostris extrusa TaxID=172846 RepID=A0AAV4UUA4_CAEEX|nr:hypothetical protein CEXT_430671 [Caerostris extrusa]